MPSQQRRHQGNGLTQGRQDEAAADAPSTVPAVPFGFWVAKVLATTLAELCDRSLGIGHVGGLAKPVDQGGFAASAVQAEAARSKA